jgi:hypothetical protein
VVNRTDAIALAEIGVVEMTDDWNQFFGEDIGTE